MASLDQNQDDKTVELILKHDPDRDDYVKEITDDPLLDEECPVTCPLPEQKSNPSPVPVPTPTKPKQTRKSFACTQCNEHFPTNKKMLVHMIKHSEKHEGPQYLCESCPSRFASEEHLNRHMSEKHRKRQPASGNLTYKYPCPGCKTGFMKRGMLILHLTKTHPEMDIDKCKILKVEMFEEEKNWMCPYCDRKYLSSGKRREHIRKCHPNKELPPTLLIADKANALVNVVKKTQKIPHKCPYCVMEYAHRTKLLKHCKDKHKDKPIPYKYQKWKAREIQKRELERNGGIPLPEKKTEQYANSFPAKTISDAVTVSHSTPSHQNWIDLPINDEDTRHSLGSFMSDITPTTPHQPVPLHSSTQITASTPTDGGPFRAITTPTSEICKSELLEQNLVQDTLNSQSMPANPNSAFIQWSAHSSSTPDFRVIEETTSNSNSNSSSHHHHLSAPTSSSLISLDCHQSGPNHFLSNPRARNATFNGISLMSDNLIEEDSAQSAPPGFTFGPNFDPLEDVEHGSGSDQPVLQALSPQRTSRDDLLSQAFNSALNESTLEDSISSDKKFNSAFPHLSFSDQSGMSNKTMSDSHHDPQVHFETSNSSHSSVIYSQSSTIFMDPQQQMPAKIEIHQAPATQTVIGQLIQQPNGQIVLISNRNDLGAMMMNSGPALTLQPQHTLQTIQAPVLAPQPDNSVPSRNRRRGNQRRTRASSRIANSSIGTRGKKILPKAAAPATVDFCAIQSTPTSQPAQFFIEHNGQAFPCYTLGSSSTGVTPQAAQPQYIVTNGEVV